ncbi:MAG: fumarylacetoacetate hydrolase family protein [Bacteroidetes bacterium]|nr:fumarylacetoacetate hydrolase family protein [Bacteroidota bacterium]
MIIELDIKSSSKKFSVNNVFCIGKNYVDHIHEFANPEIPKEPVVFLKPNTSIIKNNGSVSVPELEGKKISNDLQNEVELIIAIGKDTYKVSEEKAIDHIFGYAIGLDLTLRDIQAYEKSKGLPWTTAKGFYSSCAVSEIVEKREISNHSSIKFSLDKNNDRIQFGDTSLMIFNISKIIHYLSHIFKLVEGDLIFTGTPKGISTLYSGDKLCAKLEDLIELNITVE